MSDIVTINATDTVRVADCVAFVADVVGHELDDSERQVLLAALEYTLYDGSGSYQGAFNLDGGYGTKLNDVIFAVVRFIGPRLETQRHKDNLSKVARVAMKVDKPISRN